MMGHLSVIGLEFGLTFLCGLVVGLLFWHHAGSMSFWAGVFSEGGKPSYSRVASAFALIVSLSWISWEIRASTSMADVSMLIREIGPFLAIVLGLTYGVNKVGGTIVGIKNGRNGTAAPPSAPTPAK